MNQEIIAHFSNIEEIQKEDREHFYGYFREEQVKI